MKKILMVLMLVSSLFLLCTCETKEKAEIPKETEVSSATRENADIKSEKNNKADASKPVQTTPAIKDENDTSVQTKTDIPVAGAEDTPEVSNTSTANKTPAVCSHSVRSKVTREASCTEDGCIIYKCAECGQELERVSVPASGHCFEDGICKICGACDPNSFPFSSGVDYELPEDKL